MGEINEFACLIEFIDKIVEFIKLKKLDEAIALASSTKAFVAGLELMEHLKSED